MVNEIKDVFVAWRRKRKTKHVQSRLDHFERGYRWAHDEVQKGARITMIEASCYDYDHSVLNDFDRGVLAYIENHMEHLNGI